MRFSVHLTTAAQQDFEVCYDFIAERSQRGADTWSKAFEKMLAALVRDPHCHALAPESGDHPQEIRQILFRTRHGHNYRALYLIQDQIVHVLHVRGPGQDLMATDDLKLP